MKGRGERRSCSEITEVSVALVSDEQRARTHAPLQQVPALRLGARLQLAAMVVPRGAPSLYVVHQLATAQPRDMG